MSRVRSKTHSAASQPRIDRVSREHGDDSYGLRGKLPDPTVCTECGASYHEGRWTWRPAPAESHRTCCPACRRIQDDYPAGIVTLEGTFLESHRQEIESLARNLEEREKADRPLKRIMRITQTGDGSLEIATTDAHLARGIGTALHDAYAGELDAPFTDSENLVRIHWRR